ncbi:MAG: SH3 domain-containing protein, partial [Myxococcales bacterium]|nr:SH3 domain-containing protein [Myxococcales bacterium]
STSSGAVVGYVTRGERLAVLGGEGRWVRVSAPSGTDAWIHASLVRSIDAPAASRSVANEARGNEAPTASIENEEVPTPARAAPRPAPRSSENSEPPHVEDSGADQAAPLAALEADLDEASLSDVDRRAILEVRRGFRVDVLDAEIKDSPSGGRYAAIGAYVHNEGATGRLERLTVRCDLLSDGERVGRSLAQIATDAVGPGGTAFVVFHVPTAAARVTGARVVVDDDTPDRDLAELGAPPTPEIALQKTDLDVAKPVVYLMAQDGAGGNAGAADRVALRARPATSDEGVAGWARPGHRVRLTGRAADATDGRVYFRVQTFTGDEGWIPSDQVRVGR